jgi:hypothetical protein
MGGNIPGGIKEFTSPWLFANCNVLGTGTGTGTGTAAGAVTACLVLRATAATATAVIVVVVTYSCSRSTQMPHWELGRAHGGIDITHHVGLVCMNNRTKLAVMCAAERESCRLVCQARHAVTHVTRMVHPPWACLLHL